MRNYRLTYPNSDRKYMTTKESVEFIEELGDY